MSNVTWHTEDTYICKGLYKAFVIVTDIDDILLYRYGPWKINSTLVLS